jgi:hypothetical protein
MIRKILTLLFIFTLTQLYSQIKEKEYENIYFLKFKVFKTNLESGIPFVEICFSDKNSEFIIDCIETDFDGYASFHINPNKYHVDSTYLRVRTLKGNNNDYGKTIKIPLNQIELLKKIKIETDLKIALTEYKILNEKEYKTHRKKYRLFPDRGPAKVK